MRLPYLLSALLAGLLLAGCGGGGSAALDSADVGSTHITKVMFNQVMNEQLKTLQAEHESVPKPGSSAYATLRSQVMTALVQDAEFEQEASKLGINVTASAVNTQLTQMKKQDFGGSEAEYQKQLKAQGFTDASVRQQIRENLIQQQLYDKVTANATASSSQIAAYYKSHKSQYKTKASRAVRYILVGKNKQSLAQSLESQLKSGSASAWCTLAKKYSQDPSTKNTCGKTSFQQGQTVPAFNSALFSLATNAVTSVNTPQYGWFVLEPIAKATPAGTETEAQASAAIKSQLEEQDQNQQMTNWVTGITKNYCSGSKIKYQAGYAPSPDPCASLATATDTTTTG
jgi:parvulin-like peptidyl-prolyl isomerase